MILFLTHILTPCYREGRYLPRRNPITAIRIFDPAEVYPRQLLHSARYFHHIIIAQFRALFLKISLEL